MDYWVMVQPQTLTQKVKKGFPFLEAGSSGDFKIPIYRGREVPCREFPTGAWAEH